MEFSETVVSLEYRPGNATPVRVIAGGAGQAILFLHGWIASGRKWLNIMNALPEGRRLYSIDLPGFGASPPLPRREITIENYRGLWANFVAGVASEMEIFAVVAYSLGAILTLKLLDTPGLKGARLFLSGCPIHGLPAIFRICHVPGLVSLNLRLIRLLPRAVAIPVIKASSFASMSDSRYVDGPKIDDVLSSDPLTSERLAAQLCRSCADEIAARPGGPRSAVLRGRGDLFVSDRSARWLAGRLGAEYHEIAGARHNPMIENESEYVRILKAFLTE